MHRLLGLVVGTVLVVLALVPAGAAVRKVGSPALGTLLGRYVPILVLHPEERFRPVPVDGFLADSDLLRRTATGWEKVEGPLPADGANLRLDQRQCSAVNGIAAADCYARAQAAHPSPPVVYGAGFRRGNRIALEYWIFYVYDDFSPTVPPGDIWQVHEGDWEAVSVILDAQGTPLSVGLSSHCAGTRRSWATAPKRGTHPISYVALGSHANFFAPGKEPLDPACWTPQGIAIIKAFGAEPVDHTGRGATVRPRLVRVSATRPSWMAFAGTWGEDGYVHFPNNEPLVNGAGPPGPAFHSLWRRPIGVVLGWPRG